MGEKLDFAGKNPTDDSENLPDFKLDFTTNNVFGGMDLTRETFFGKPFPIFDINNIDFGRESLGILNLDSLNPERESFLTAKLSDFFTKVSVQETEISKGDEDRNKTKNFSSRIEPVFSNIRERVTIPEDDLFRESLGIINIKNLDFDTDANFLDFGRESLMIRDLSKFDIGRDSLGILSLRNSDFGTDSGLGRESLSILNLNNLDFMRESLISDTAINILSEDPLANLVSSKPSSILQQNLGTELINPDSETNLKVNNPTKSQETLSVVTNPQKVSPLPEVLVTKSDESNPSIFNKGFLDALPLSSTSSTCSVYPSFNSGSLNSSSFPSRIFSTPSNGGLDVLNDAFGDSSDLLKRLQTCTKSTSSPDSLTKIKNGVSNDDRGRIMSLPTNLESNTDFEDDNFNDSVFLEAKHLSMRIADGSFLADNAESDMLDSIKQPEDLVIMSPAKCDSETIFKSINKFVPSGSKKTSPTTPLEIINSVSEILSQENLSNEQRSEGQHLLCSLAEMISNSSAKSRVLDDSGHSSIESNHAVMSEPECYEVLDLSKKSADFNVNKSAPAICEPLDLSVKSKSGSEKSFKSPKVLPPKCNTNRQKSLVNITQTLTRNWSMSSNEDVSSENLSKPLKPKKIEQTNVKKGPLKAVLPVDSMAKGNPGKLKITPKSSSKPESKLKKTSTPINRTSMKPMAQSTPDGPKNALSTPSSPLARPYSQPPSPKALQHKLNSSATKLPTKSKITSLQRKNSFDGFQNPQKTERFVRSYSLGNKSQSASSVLQENKKIVKNKRPSFGKKIGKENKN